MGGASSFALRWPTEENTGPEQIAKFRVDSSSPAASRAAPANTAVGKTILLNRLFAEPGAAISVVGQQTCGEEGVCAVGMNGRLVRGLMIALICSATAFLVVFRISGSRIVWSELHKVSGAVIGAALGLVLAGWASDSARISVLARAIGAEIGFWSGLRISIAGQFVSSLMPFNAGGEPVQVYLLKQEGLGLGEASAAIAMRTLCNAVARVMVALITLAWIAVSGVRWHVPRQMKAAMMTGLALYLAIFSFSMLLVADPRRIETVVAPALRSRAAMWLFRRRGARRLLGSINRSIAEFQSALYHYWKRQRPTLLVAVFLSAAGWVAIALVPAIILAGLGVRAPSEQIMGNVILFYMASSYVPTPGASGFAELGFAELFSLVVPSGLLGLAVALWRLLTYYFTLVVGGALVVGQMLYGRMTSPVEDERRT